MRFITKLGTIHFGNSCCYSVQKLLSWSPQGKMFDARIYETVILSLAFGSCEMVLLAVEEDSKFAGV
jgi:hypothetical protein